MTLDEAIKHCEEVAEWLKELKKFREQEPCEDCVSREDVITIIAKKHMFKDKSDFDKCVHLIAKQVKSLSPVTPEPKTGHWIYIGQSEINGLKICKCSECGKRTYGSLDYCGNCGAKMEVLE